MPANGGGMMNPGGGMMNPGGGQAPAGGGPDPIDPNVQPGSGGGGGGGGGAEGGIVGICGNASYPRGAFIEVLHFAGAADGGEWQGRPTGIAGPRNG